MKVKQLREALLTIAADARADSLAQLANLMQPLDLLDVSDLTKTLSAALEKRAKAEATKQAKTQQAAVRAKEAAAQIEAAIARYTQELEETKSDNLAFEQVVKRIEADRSIKAVHAEQIAHRFISTKREYKTKKAATKAMLQRQIADKRAAQRSSQVSGIF